ncbi:unnamed protein product [Mycena citricolor]|uniref:Uncharacterized protein n=1 Tax=Mycena citricolor TaxID=2018698 RepID=A0AAD2GTR8_9AGAR|nr:unnamed protein product [Mycena citricolor]
MTNPDKIWKATLEEPSGQASAGPASGDIGGEDQCPTGKRGGADERKGIWGRSAYGSSTPWCKESGLARPLAGIRGRWPGEEGRGRMSAWMEMMIGGGGGGWVINRIRIPHTNTARARAAAHSPRPPTSPVSLPVRLRAHTLRSNRALRPSEPRNLRLEFRAISQNPLNLSDTAHHTDSSSEDLLVPVPHELPHHYNSDSPHSNLPTIDSLTDSSPSSQSSSPSFILRPVSPSPSPPPPPPPPNQNMAAVVPMPARGARGAPEFDPSKPRELPRFFTDLEYHFGLASIADAQERKRHALRFLPFDEAELLESLDSFSVPHNYDAWKAEVLKLYPGTDSDRKYATSDLHALIGKYASSGINSRAEYSKFYRLFLVISKYLLLKQRLSLVEQSRAFRTAIAPASLWNRVHQRLQIKKPDVHPEDPYELSDMNEAVEFVLADSTGSFSFQTTAPPAASSPVTVKSEADPNLAILGEILKLLVAQNAARLGPAPAVSSTTLLPSYPAPPRDAALLGHVTMHPPPPPPIIISIHADIRPLPPSPGRLPRIPASGLAKPDSLHQGVLLPLVPDALALICTTPLPSRALVLASDVSTGWPGTGLATGLLQCGLPLLVSQELAITGPSEPLTILSGFVIIYLSSAIVPWQ